MTSPPTDAIEHRRQSEWTKYIKTLCELDPDPTRWDRMFYRKEIQRLQDHIDWMTPAYETACNDRDHFLTYNGELKQTSDALVADNERLQKVVADLIKAGSDVLDSRQMYNPTGFTHYQARRELQRVIQQCRLAISEQGETK